MCVLGIGCVLLIHTILLASKPLLSVAVQLGCSGTFFSLCRNIQHPPSKVLVPSIEGIRKVTCTHGFWLVDGML